MTERTARCCCGDLSITVSGDPKRILSCHCDYCQRRTGNVNQVSCWFTESQVVSKRGTTRSTTAKTTTMSNTVSVRAAVRPSTGTFTRSRNTSGKPCTAWQWVVSTNLIFLCRKSRYGVKTPSLGRRNRRHRTLGGIPGTGQAVAATLGHAKAECIKVMNSVR